MLRKKLITLAHDYFFITWDGINGQGLKDGCDGILNLCDCIDNLFHPDYLFLTMKGTLISKGTSNLKEVLIKLTSSLKDLKMTSFNVVNTTSYSVEFITTSFAKYKADDRTYGQYVHLNYIFKAEKVSEVYVKYHTSYLKQLINDTR